VRVQLARGGHRATAGQVTTATPGMSRGPGRHERAARG
jgi:hypothetical protein